MSNSDKTNFIELPNGYSPHAIKRTSIEIGRGTTEHGEVVRFYKHKHNVNAYVVADKTSDECRHNVLAAIEFNTPIGGAVSVNRKFELKEYEHTNITLDNGKGKFTSLLWPLSYLLVTVGQLDAEGL